MKKLIIIMLVFCTSLCFGVQNRYSSSRSYQTTRSTQRVFGNRTFPQKQNSFQQNRYVQRKTESKIVEIKPKAIRDNRYHYHYHKPIPSYYPYYYPYYKYHIYPYSKTPIWVSGYWTYETRPEEYIDSWGIVRIRYKRVLIWINGYYKY